MIGNCRVFHSAPVFPPGFLIRKKKKTPGKEQQKGEQIKPSDGIRKEKPILCRLTSYRFFRLGRKKNRPRRVGKMCFLYYYRPLIPSLETLCLSWATFQDILFNDDCYKKLQQQSVNFWKIFRALSPENDRLFAKKKVHWTGKKSLHSLKLRVHTCKVEPSQKETKKSSTRWFKVTF